ncbi:MULTISPECIES: DUF4385 family protein [unclassified Meiothermus]|uniref:DUF4385 family protein n=1 Tax=unclassified Meiothermus TaxID=370471 RepID=UPI00102078CB|nr:MULTISPECIES: DUF4385 family protein [unclassified Meiothermus]RYM33739.1 DUF4385 family protein [Meiothermus sp. PNK-Is4]
MLQPFSLASAYRFYPSLEEQVERTLEMGQLLLRWPFCDRVFAQQAIEVFLELYRVARAEGDFRFMALACKCLQLGWVRTPSGDPPRRFRERRFSLRPYLAYRVKPEIGQMFYQAYLRVIEDPEYHRLKAQHQPARSTC